MGRPLIFLAAAMAAAALAGPCGASGDGVAGPWYLDQFGGDRPDQQAFYAGRVGIVMARAPRPRLLAAWRLLHGLKVGDVAGEALSRPCCDTPAQVATGGAAAPPSPLQQWIAARKLVPGAPELAPAQVETDRDGPNYTTIPNCYEHAFAIAAQTLRDRARRYGAASPEVRNWLQTQDAVFESCGKAGVSLPSALAASPSWLKADRTYQEAAFDLYDGRAQRAGAGFGAIAADSASPWRPWGLYLQARALERVALDHPSAEAAAVARTAIQALADGPAGTLEKEEVTNLSHILEFRYDPTRLMAELDSALRRSDPPPNIAILFRDYSDLSDATSAKLEIADWMATLAARPIIKDEDIYSPPTPERVQAYVQARRSSLLHAIGRWQESHDRAWLLAALSLVDPGEPEARSLIAEGRATPASYPGWLTIQHHLIRLELPTGDPAVLRRRLDVLLARGDLSVSDRNILLAERTQVSAGLHDFAVHALRRRLCHEAWDARSCARDNWYYVEEAGPFDGDHGNGDLGLGEDARSIIDRMPLAQRMALSRDPALPEKLRLDIALTNFARALQLENDQALDALARQLDPMLPQLRAEWRRIPTASPGVDKRFAVGMVMAKIPGLRVDLIDYVRPEGTVRQFQNHWMDWIILPRGKGVTIEPPPPPRYQRSGYTPAFELDPRTYQPTAAATPRSDLSCLGECGRGAAPLRIPDFVDQQTAQAERAYFVQRPDTQSLFDYATGKPIDPPPTPAGGAALWDELLAYGRAHPDDPRMPESLYWIIHASHFGASHDHSGRRAFQRLHLRYPKSVWARRAPAYSE